MTETTEPPSHAQCIKFSNEANTDIHWEHFMFLIETRDPR